MRRVVGLLPRAGVIVLFIINMTSTVSAEVDANGWRKLNEFSQIGYMAGVLDVAVNLRELSAAWAKNSGDNIQDYWMQHPEVGLFASAVCLEVRRLPPDQKFAILKKYVADNPKLWEGPMALMVVAAFSDMCK